MFKKSLALIIGIAVGVLGILLIQNISSQMYPWPEGLKYSDTEKVKAYFAELPLGAFLMVILSYIVGSFFGGLVATSLSKEGFRSAIIVGGVLTLAGIANALNIPQPLWVSMVSVLVFIPFALLGAKCVPTKFKAD